MSNDPSQQPTPDASTSSLDGNLPPIAPDGSQSQPLDASAPIGTTEGVQGGKNQLKPKRKRPSAFRKVRAKVQHFQMQRLRKAENPTPQEDRKRAVYELRLPWWQKAWRWTGLGDKNGWDWAQLLAVPIMLAIVTWGLSEYAKSRDQQQQQADKEREQQQQQADKEKAQAIADDKAKQDTLVKYLDDMAGSLKDGLLKAKPGDDKYIIAQSRTVLALQSLDKNRRRLVIQFLQASGLNQVSEDKDTQEFLKKLDSWNRPKPPKNARLGLLYGAQMAKANLANSDLSRATLIGAFFAGANLRCNPPGSKEPEHCSDLSDADLRGANLFAATLSGADLTYANFRVASLNRANLNEANLSYADLRSADLWWTNLSGTDLKGTDFGGAILLGTELDGAKNLTSQQLAVKNAPLLCNVQFPQYITGIDPNRDCERIAQLLVERYPEDFTDLESVQKWINQERQEKFK